VAILDADKEGFLRSAGALIQTMGRAARHVRGRAVLYADEVTDSMRQAIGETSRRRLVQEAYNVEHDITPASIVKNIHDVLSSVYERDYVTVPTVLDERERFRTRAELEAFIVGLEREMRDAATNLEFERAATIRDRLRRLRNPDLVSAVEEPR
jgi:excinuclease ABC subunit B